MTNRITYLLAASMLLIMIGLSFAEMLGDSQTMDEVSHLHAGYSYITQKDMRINPEHPPLVKDAAGASVWLWSKISGEKINFPYESKSWQEDINGQWDFGFNFMYRLGNDADKMLFYGRLPMFLFLLLLGFYIFKWSRELFGNNTALLALFLYSFSPTFLGHGHLVTTDVAASVAIFISLYYFVRWLQAPNRKNLIIAGIIFGLALLVKFSTFLLVPLFVFLVLIWLALIILIPKMPFQNSRFLSEHGVRHLADERKNRENENSSQGNFHVSEWHFRKENKLKLFWKHTSCLILIGIIGLIIIYPAYLYHVWNYPIERQINDMRFVLNSYAEGPDQTPLESCKNLSRIGRCPAELTIWMAQKPVLRPWAQYFYGLLMVVQRASGGNTTYFLGEVSSTGWPSYFPIVYAIKEPLPMHILTIIALLFAAYSLRGFWKNSVSRFKKWLFGHIAEFSMACFIILYWASSIKSPLNIGVRHILPTFPFIYILASAQIKKWLLITAPDDLDGFVKKLKFLGKTLIAYSAKYAVVFLLLAWQIISLIAAYPYFLTYFNELVGGPKNGYIYVVDSNLDWGQDFKRLVKWADENKIDKLYVDYFGGTVGEYYLGNRLIPWSGEKDYKLLPPESYLAVSATFRQQCFGEPINGFKPLNCYQWLKDYQPMQTIGNSIFVYYIP